MGYVNKRNKLDKELLEEYQRHNESKKVIDADVIAARIQNNLSIWENTMTKYSNLPYKQTISNYIKNNDNVRLAVKSKDGNSNQRMAYTICKHLINAGISPSSIAITTLEDCYLHYRGIGEESRKKREAIFNDNVSTILIEDVRDMQITDVSDNVNFFWVELFNRLKKDKNMNLILSFIDSKSNNWLPKNMRKELEEVGIVEI